MLFIAHSAKLPFHRNSNNAGFGGAGVPPAIFVFLDARSKTAGGTPVPQGCACDSHEMK